MSTLPTNSLVPCRVPSTPRCNPLPSTHQPQLPPVSHRSQCRVVASQLVLAPLLFCDQIPIPFIVSNFNDPYSSCPSSYSALLFGPTAPYPTFGSDPDDSIVLRFSHLTHWFRRQDISNKASHDSLRFPATSFANAAACLPTTFVSILLVKHMHSDYR